MAQFFANTYRCTFEYVNLNKPTKFMKAVALVAAKTQSDAEVIAYYVAGISPVNPGGTSGGTPAEFAKCITPNLTTSDGKVTLIEMRRQEDAPGAVAVGGTANP
jgi:hypothetical protein